MGSLNKGDKVWCIPTRIDEQSKVIFVRVPGTKENARMVLADLFFQEADTSCSFLGGAVVSHQPYDVVRVDRPFAAKVTATDRLVLSRTERIRELWQELEVKAKVGGYVLAQITGQNKTLYSLNIEGNLSVRCAKAPLTDYLASRCPNERTARKHSPMEGDTVAAKVVSASGNVLELDLVKPLERLEAGRLDDVLLRLFGSRGFGGTSPGVEVDVGLEDGFPSTRPLEIEHSPDLDGLREATQVLVVDDDPSFADHLAWLLQGMGYQSEAVKPPASIEELRRRISANTVLLIDASMDPVDGVALIGQLHERPAGEGSRGKCILMSALRWDAPFGTARPMTLGEAVEAVEGLCLRWRKSPSDLEAGLKELDDLILRYEDRLAKREHDPAFLQPPPEPVPSVEEGEAKTALPAEPADALQWVLDELKDKTGAEWVALFAMDRSAGRVHFLAGDEVLGERCRQYGAQSYLPNSPIRDLSYQQTPVLWEGHVDLKVPRFRNLLRFFEKGSLDVAVERAAFRSVAAVRLDVGTSIQHSLFIFHSKAEAFHRESIRPLLDSAASQIEIILLKDIHATQNRIQQPFYLEGLARAGLRHDAEAQLTDIQMMARIVASSIQRGDTTKALSTVQKIESVARSAHGRIQESLDCTRTRLSSREIELRQVIEYAKGIASGVAARSRDKRQKVEFVPPHYPDQQPLTVTGDPNSLQRILENLLVNAVEHGLAFIRPTVSILVEVQRMRDERFPFAILVHDNGPGIHGMDRPRIFDPLFSTKENGYGMGLAVARRIAQENGLTLDLLASAVLVGTTFRIKVPRQMTPSTYRGVP